MKSKASVRQQLHFVLQILNAALISFIVIFCMSVSLFAQNRLPFVGTRTFCGEIKGTTATISIRKDGYTTVKTNMVTGLNTQLVSAPYETYSGMLNAKGILKRGNFILTIKSATDINVYEYPNQDYIDGKLCTTNEVLPKESRDVQPTPKTRSKTTFTQTYTEVSFVEVKDLEGLIKLFPFLKNELDDVIEINKDEEFEKTQVYISDLDQKDMPRLIFVAMNGINCGAALCSLTVYMDQGKGFTNVLDALTLFGAPVYISKDQTSLLICSRGGRGELKLKNNAFESAGSPRTTQKLAPCSVRRFGNR